MKFAAVAFLVAASVLAMPPSIGPRHILPIVGRPELIDGDTYRVQVQVLPGLRYRTHLRLAGVDTPESGGRAQCEAERQRSKRAKAWADSLLRQGRIFELSAPAHGKYRRPAAGPSAGRWALGGPRLDRPRLGPPL